MKALVSTAVISVFALLGAANANADSRPGADARPGADSRPDGYRAKGNLCAKIECTSAQKTEIVAIRAEFKADTADERAAMRELRAQLRAAKVADGPDAKRIADLQAKRHATREAIKIAKATAREAVHATLTPEQREAITVMKAERKAQRREGKRAKHTRKGKHARKGKRGKRGPTE